MRTKENEAPESPFVSGPCRDCNEFCGGKCQTQARKPVPTIETHRFVGMFRPPWESVQKLLGDELYNLAKRSFSNAASLPPDYRSPSPILFTQVGKKTFADESELRVSYLAGDFDVPQYEPLHRVRAGVTTLYRSAPANESDPTKAVING